MLDEGSIKEQEKIKKRIINKAIPGFEFWEQDEILQQELNSYCYRADGNVDLSDNVRQYVLQDLQREHNRISDEISYINN